MSLLDRYRKGLVPADDVRAENELPPVTVYDIVEHPADYLPNRPVGRGQIKFFTGRRFRREGPPPVKPSAKRKYGRG